MARYTNDVKLVGVTLLVASILSVSACDFTSRSTGLPLPPFVEDHQAAVQKIIDDCYERPDVAKPKYIQEWNEEALDRAKSKEITFIVPQLAKAGCLIELNPERYLDYYAYINNHLDDENWEIAAAAASALRGAKGRESIDHLVKMARDDRPFVASNAVSSIGYRITTSFYSESLKDDHAYALARLTELCTNPDSVRGLRRV
jgi:hypothetical protein